MPGGSILITSAPKSDRMVAAAGPAIQLAQSITLRPVKRLSVIAHSPNDRRQRSGHPVATLDIGIVTAAGRGQERDGASLIPSAPTTDICGQRYVWAAVLGG